MLRNKPKISHFVKGTAIFVPSDKSTSSFVLRPKQILYTYLRSQGGTSNFITNLKLRVFCKNEWRWKFIPFQVVWNLKFLSNRYCTVYYIPSLTLKWPRLNCWIEKLNIAQAKYSTSKKENCYAVRREADPAPAMFSKFEKYYNYWVHFCKKSVSWDTLFSRKSHFPVDQFLSFYFVKTASRYHPPTNFHFHKVKTVSWIVFSIGLS